MALHLEQNPQHSHNQYINDCAGWYVHAALRGDSVYCPCINVLAVSEEPGGNIDTSIRRAVARIYVANRGEHGGCKDVIREFEEGALLSTGGEP